MKNLCLIIGAGASYDCVCSDVVVEKSPNLKPPLTKDIFSSRYDFLLEKYPKASALAVDLRMDLRDNTSDSLEKLLRQMQERATPTRLKQIRQVPLYLRELFSDVSYEYINPAQTCYAMLINKICDNEFDKILVINLNYDVLFESALQIIQDIKFERIEDYFNASKKWKIFKPHGSVNWIRRIIHGGVVSGGHDPDLKLIDGLDQIELDGPIHIRGIKKYQLGNNHAYPCMVIPVEGKYEFCCPEEHVREAQKLLGECSAFLTIGYSFKDEDVNDLLKQHVKNAHRTEIVSMMDDTSSPLYCQFREKTTNLFGDNCLNNQGFSNFIASGACDKFFDELRRTVSNIFWNKVPLDP